MISCNVISHQNVSHSHLLNEKRRGGAYRPSPLHAVKLKYINEKVLQSYHPDYIFIPSAPE